MQKSTLVRSAIIGMTVAAGAAQAALPAEAIAAFTGISDNATAVIALVWPIMATVTGAFILMRLFKKGANKSV